MSANKVTIQGANKKLSNLIATEINTSLISDTDSTDDLGSSSKYWANTYTDKIFLNATATLDGSVAGLVNIIGDAAIKGTGNTNATTALQVLNSEESGNVILNCRNNQTVSIGALADPDEWARFYVAGGGFRCDDDFRFKKDSGAQYFSRIGGAGYDLVFQCGGDNLILYGGGAGVGGVRVGSSGQLLGFYGTSPIALQTGVAETAAGIHAALVALGLITA